MWDDCGGLCEAAVGLFWGRSRADGRAGAAVKACGGYEHCFGAGYNSGSGPEWLWGTDVAMGLLWGGMWGCGVV